MMTPFIREESNPLITPEMVKPSRGDFEVVCAFNAGVAEYEGEILLLLRVAEKPSVMREGYITVPALKQMENSRHMSILRPYPICGWREAGMESTFLWMKNHLSSRIASWRGLEQRMHGLRALEIPIISTIQRCPVMELPRLLQQLRIFARLRKRGLSL